MPAGETKETRAELLAAMRKKRALLKRAKMGIDDGEPSVRQSALIESEDERFNRIFNTPSAWK
jgi:hypothetical protein